MRKRLPFLGLSSFLITLSLLLGPNLLASDSKTKNLRLEAERTILQKLSLNDGVFYGNFGMIQNGNFNLMSPATVEYTAEDLDYCLPTISFTVEPMTRVVFAGIDNPSSATSTDAYEDFTAIEGEVTQGETYPIALEGYTGGNFTNYFTVWVDWNQDGTFESSEMTEVGSISGSTGTDGQQATSDIIVPVDATLGTTRMRVIKNYNTSPTNPCGTYSYGQIEDYTINVNPMNDCSGTPDAGTAAVTPTEANPGAEYTVSADGYTIAAGLSFQWQSNTDGAGWVNEGEATEIYGDFTATAPLEVGTEVEWRLLVTCTHSGETTESTTATFTTVLEYCTPTYTYSEDYLNAVSTEGAVEDISYTNSVGGVHSDQTSLIIKTYPGQVFDLNTAYVGGGQTIGAWVDWNENGTFGVDNPDERIALSNGSSPQSFTVTIPGDIEPGDYIFRVRGSWGNHVSDGDNFACNNKSYGSSIDVTLRVEALDDCTGTPTGGEATVNPIEGVAGSTYTVSATDFSIGSGMIYQWQSNTNGAGWVDEGDVMSNYENFTAVATGEPEDTIEWRLLVTCTHSGETSESTTASFTIALYCIPEGINPGRYINNFSTTGATQNISNMGTGFSTGGYANFTDTHTVEQAAGEDVEFEVDIVGGTAGFRIWVDWNQDGEFDTTEEVAWHSNSFESTHSGSFTVPADALEGETRMRIVSHWSSNTGNVDPCATGFNSGEFEDYKFIVTENDGGTDPEPTEYCEPELDCTDGDIITNVTFQEISNDTTCSPDGYGDYTDMVASVDAGSTYPISVTVGDGWLYESVSVWIDFDNSGTFDENEFYFIGTGSDEVLTGDIAIPADVEEGNYRMRVRVAAVGSALSTWDMSCDETQTYGETEDYTVQVSNDGTTEPEPEDPCDEKVIMECGVEYTADLVPNAGQWANYTGVTWTYNGSEQVFEFTADMTGDYEFILDQGAADADFMVMDACSNTANNLIGGYWTGEVNQTLFLTEGQTIYIIADLFSSSTPSTVSIQVNCPTEPFELTCEDNFVASNNLENGSFFGGTNNQHLAIDVHVGDEGFTVYGMDLNIFTDGNTELDFYFTVYEDDGGLPGAVFNDNGYGQVISNEYLGDAFGYDVYNFVVKFDSSIDLEANTTYWIEVESTGVAWESTSEGVLGATAAFKHDGTGGAWSLATNEMVYSLVCEQLGVSDLSSFDFAYYPNPVRDVLNITSQKAVQSVEVYNLTGQKVINESKVNQGQIDVSKLSAGTYVFRVTLEGGQVETFKIIKR